MANTTRKGGQRQPSSVRVRYPQERPETAKIPDGLTNESKSTLELPILWHGSSRSECWTSTSGTASGNWASPFAVAGRPALRLRRAPRRCSPLHRLRPIQEAAVRFVSERGEFLTD